ncbi:MAPK regulated corepressor interacting protein 2-like [Heterocephalus glaber]|uniref:MAPK regulated corepressor interacting protein 2-like n=1 Tax=Heterocephalus glaber TaxID=10181 RepID=A0AAX6S983_HETGA|nr:MAPK regulated corepressor interacting protein 2-like [Heterocephalus glaber]
MHTITKGPSKLVGQGHTAWQLVEQQLDGSPGANSGPKSVQYVERTPDSSLQNLVLTDMGEWWA